MTDDGSLFGQMRGHVGTHARAPSHPRRRTPLSYLAFEIGIDFISGNISADTEWLFRACSRHDMDCWRQLLNRQMYMVKDQRC